jgi:hypothetical protein
MLRAPSKQDPIYKFNTYASIILSDVREIRQYAIDNNLLDTQEFLNFMDELNKLTIDPEPEVKYLGGNKIEINGEVHDL